MEHARCVCTRSYHPPTRGTPRHAVFPWPVRDRDAHFPSPFQSIAVRNEPLPRERDSGTVVCCRLRRQGQLEGSRVKRQLSDHQTKAETRLPGQS
jgi:hypothetical protein